MTRMAIFISFVFLVALAGMNVWSLVSGRRLSSRQIAPPAAVRCRSAGGLLLIVVVAAVIGRGAGEAVDRFGPLLLVALLVGAALLIAGEVIERRRDAGTETSVRTRVAPSRVAVDESDAIELPQPKGRGIELRDGTAKRTPREPRPPVDETKTIRLPRSD